MILTPNILARMVAIVLLGVILQLSFFSQVALFHVAPDVLPALVISLGLLGGSLTGAVCGFSVGFLLDCLLIAPLGGGSLVLLSTGYLAGLFRERFEIDNQLMVPLLCVAGTLFAELGFGAVQLMLGIDAPISTLVLRDMLIKSAFAFFLGWPIYIGVKRALRPALIEEPDARRGRRLRRRGPGRRRRTPTVMGA
jgi:rod shape-determining protein MreD